MTTESTRSEEKSHNEGRRAFERAGPEEQSGTSGVSDQRRAELERMEAEAGTQHEGADESVAQQPAGRAQGVREREDSLASQDHRGSANPDIDKR